MIGGRVERRLAAVLAADVVGYSRLMGEDELGTLEALKAHLREVVDPAVAGHNGRIVKTTGDGMLVEFASAVDAVICAVAVQEKMAGRNGSFTPKITFRIGINIGDIIIDGDDIFGDGVNVAARVETECEPGGVYLSDDAYRQVRGKTSFTFDDLGERSLKNIDRPLRLYATKWAGSMPVASVAGNAQKAKSLSLSNQASIVVLPFQNASSDPEQAYFAEGLTANLTTDLSRVSDMLVIAATTSVTFAGSSADIRGIARELGVKYILRGTLQKAVGKLRINAQLVEAATAVQLWSDRFDGDESDLFVLQDRITARIANSIGRQIAVALALEAEARTSNPAAADFLIRGIAISNKPQSVETLREQETLFRSVLALEPQNAEAWARLARAVLLQGINFVFPPRLDQLNENLRDAREAVESAIRFGPNNARSYLAEGLLHHALGDPRQSARANEVAVSLDRNLTLARANWGAALIRLGEPDKAIPHMEEALQLDPLGPQVPLNQINLGKAYLLLSKPQEAIEWLLRAKATNPGLARAYAYLAVAYAQNGDEAAARQTTADLLRLAPEIRLSTSPFAPGPLFPKAYRAYYEQILVPFGKMAGIPE